MVQNKYSEKGYRDVVLNISGLDETNVNSFVMKMQYTMNCMVILLYT